eukprot:5106625-Amphidinium_carterae.2
MVLPTRLELVQRVWLLVYQRGDRDRRCTLTWTNAVKQVKQVQRAWCLRTLQRLLSRRSGDTRSAYPACRVNSALSYKELRAPVFDDEAWLSEVPSETVAKGVTLSSNKVEALEEHGEILSNVGLLAGEPVTLRRR